MTVAIAIDVGGTKIAAGLVGPDRRIRASVRATTTAEAWRDLSSLLDNLLAGTSPGDVVGVGVGCGGPMDWPAGVVSPLNMGFREFPLRARLAERFPGLPVRLHNDAVCTAVGEHWQGAGEGRSDMLGMVVSTGVGGGLILDGRLRDGPTGNAGHVGHVIVEPDGPACGCGGHGCLEAVARGPALLTWARERGWAGADGRALAAAAAAGHEVARAVYARAGRAVATAIAGVAATLDLDLVVLGGGVAQSGPVLFAPLAEELRRRARLAFLGRLRVVPAALGPAAGLFGAAALVLAGDRYWSAD